MKLIVLIPSFNEEDTIGHVIQQIPKSMDGVDEIIPLVIDDGSQDNTAEVAKQAGAVVITHQQNRGVGIAFQTGLTQALGLGAGIMVNIDADGQFSPSEIPALIAPILSGEADFVSGDRFTNEGGKIAKPKNMSTVKYWGNIWMAKLISLLCRKEYHDVSCGFRAYSREALFWLNLSGKFTYTQESFLDFSYKGLKIKSVPVHVTYFKNRQSKVANNLWAYMIKTLKIILRSYRDYNPIQFFGWLGFIPFTIGFVCAIFMLVHYIQTRVFTPYKFVGFTGIYMISMALFFWIVGLLADMFMRIRITQEKLLYQEKKRKYKE